MSKKNRNKPRQHPALYWWKEQAKRIEMSKRPPMMFIFAGTDPVTQSKEDLQYFNKLFEEKTKGLPETDCVFLTPKTDEDKIKVYERYIELGIYGSRVEEACWRLYEQQSKHS